MLPVAVGFGAGSELRQPMGVSVIGGVITSTLLTLVAVPVAYSLIDDAGNWIVRRFRPAPASSDQQLSPIASQLPPSRVETS
jgi:HAE1 family hydrophobic/amphiphilic exporter-1